MPRRTRAALRTNVILEDDAGVAGTAPLPAAPRQERAPLGEIAGNVAEETLTVLEVNLSKPAKKAALAKKATGAKRGRKAKTVTPESMGEVLEDEYQSSANSAVDEACRDLLRERRGDTHPLPMHDQRPSTPPSKAVRVARKHLSPKAHALRSNPDLHQSSRPLKFGEIEDDSFVAAIGTRTPARMASHDSLQQAAKEPEKSPAPGDTLDESFAEHIISRSPLKTMCIEDSVEAIDALEEALEKVGLELPDVAEDPQPSVAAKTVIATKPKATKASTKAPVNAPVKVPVKAAATAPAKAPVKATAKASAKAPAKAGKAPVRRTAVKASITTASKPIRSRIAASTPAAITPRPAASLTPTSVGSGKSASVTAHGPAASPTNMAKATGKPTPAAKAHARVSSATRAPFVPAKSHKVPTVSTFTLPSAALTQKTKANREARLQAQVAEAAKKREFKARPVSSSTGPVVKSTAASKARVSIARREPIQPSAAKKSRSSSISSVLTSGNGHTAARVKPATTPSRANSLVVAKRPITPKTAKANTSAPRVSLARANSNVIGMPTEPAAKRTGKENPARPREEKEAREKERRRKEEAAKKARIEAAERGRLASREWAEKMKARKAAAASAPAPAAVAAGKVATA